MEIKYQTIEEKDFQKMHGEILARLLKEQRKVQGDLDQKIDRCKLICISWADNNVVAIGAIKRKTPSDFSNAGVPELSGNFKWELGYFYTKEGFTGKGIASRITEYLLENYGNYNLMASTETTANPAMVRILEKNGFCLYGKTWKSVIHGNDLGLYLRFIET